MSLFHLATFGPRRSSLQAPELPKPELAKIAEKPAIEELDEDGEVDESGVEPKDIELVMSQAHTPACAHARPWRCDAVGVAVSFAVGHSDLA